MKSFCLTLLLAFLGTMAYLPRGNAQRSPYVPMPVNIPGLLPRFGGTDNSNSLGDRSSSGQGSSAPSSGGSDFIMPSPGNELGVRVSEMDNRPPRPAPSRPSNGGRCPPQQVPCYECVVYISRIGQITVFTADEGGRSGLLTDPSSLHFTRRAAVNRNYQSPLKTTKKGQF